MSAVTRGLEVSRDRLPEYVVRFVAIFSAVWISTVIGMVATESLLFGGTLPSSTWELELLAFFATGSTWLPALVLTVAWPGGDA